VKTSFLKELEAAGLGLGRGETPATLEEGHLGGQVAALADFDPIAAGKELDEI
jgi:hypothetical protein